MARPCFDLDVLRTLVTGLELGSFAKAADRLGRSTSAVSAQLRKLEDQAGAPVLRKHGRRMVPTPTGEALLGYARRLLELNDEAMRAVRGAELQGEVRLGLQEDFGEGLLARVLAGFAHSHPRVHIDVRLARQAELLQQTERGRLDLALAWQVGPRRAPRARRLGQLPLCWIGPRDAAERLCTDEPLPLAMLEAPCALRDLAIATLERAGRPWRIACTSPSLAGVWAAAGAGLGITLRTTVGMPAGLQLLGSLPSLPRIALEMHRAETAPSPVVRQLEALITAQVQALIAAPSAGAAARV